MRENKNMAHGIGDPDFQFAVYLGNIPQMAEYESGTKIRGASEGELHHIGQVCGNGWRKVFNVYSKLLYELDADIFPYQLCSPTWQSYRDNFLLKARSGTALIFTAPRLSRDHQCIHIISGKTYAKQLIDNGDINPALIWLDEEFAISVQDKLIVCPYFDYRQLSNSKIVRLSHLIADLWDGKITS